MFYVENYAEIEDVVARGCPSADYVLDCCYTLIAVEHGIKREQQEEDDEY